MNKKLIELIVFILFCAVIGSIGGCIIGNMSRPHTYIYKMFR